MKNTISRRVYFLTAAIFMACFAATAALAGTDADKEAKHEMRKLQAQLSAVQKEKADLAAQLEEIKKQLGDLGAKSAALEKKSGGQKKQFAELTAKLQESDANLQKMTQQYSDTVKAMQQIQKEKEQVQKEKEQEQKMLSGDVRVCEKKNADLYRISTELLEKYQSKGVFTALLQAEPFTQIEKVKVENVLQEYKDKADAAKIAASKKPASAKVGEPAATAQANSPPAVSTVVSGAEPQAATQDKATGSNGQHAPQL